MRYPYLLAALLVVISAGCTTTVPVVSQPIPCQVPAEVLAEQCADPSAIKDGATYAEVIAAASEDRRSLRTCGARNRMLVRVITSCTEAIEQYQRRTVK